jgi:hypothetical protein
MPHSRVMSSKRAVDKLAVDHLCPRACAAQPSVLRLKLEKQAQRSHMQDVASAQSVKHLNHSAGI